jgi:site-specific recombinase XerD
MSKLQKNNKSIVFVDYVPAELHENKAWRIVYYVKNPITEKLERKHPRVKPLKSITERRKLAKRMILEINKRLESGWNPFFSNKGSKELAKFTDCLKIFIKRIKIEYNENNVRYDTWKTYNSQITILTNYLIETKQQDMLAYKFDVDFVGAYLDWIRYEKKRSARTRDNYLGFLGTLSTFLLQKKYITANPTDDFSKTNKKVKKRVLVPAELRDVIFDYWKDKNQSYLTLCMMCYYCLLRRTELTKLRVLNISLINSTIWIDGADSKNRKSNAITIPNELIPFLTEHLKNAKATDYLFSNNNFAAGSAKIHPDRITKSWAKMRTELEINKNVDWYSLKDSGITDLLRAGVPLISVRDQARHHSSAQTDTYTPMDLKIADKQIKDSSVKFND